MAVVTFLSDYGLDDDFVGVCHGVIARVAPDGRVIDITHGIGRHDIRAGGLVLRRALAFAVNRGSALAELGLTLGDELLIAPPPS